MGYEFLLRENNTKLECFLSIVIWISGQSPNSNAIMAMALDIFSANQSINICLTNYEFSN